MTLKDSSTISGSSSASPTTPKSPRGGANLAGAQAAGLMDMSSFAMRLSTEDGLIPLNGAQRRRLDENKVCHQCLSLFFFLFLSLC